MMETCVLSQEYWLLPFAGFLPGYRYRQRRSFHARARGDPQFDMRRAYDAAAEAKADAAMKQLHAHDRDQYVPHPAPSPFGDAPKPANTEPGKGSSN